MIMAFPATNWTMRMNCRFQLLVRCQTRMILNAVGRLAVLSAHLWAVFYSLWHKNSSGYSVSGSPCAASILHKSLGLSQQTFFIFGQGTWKSEKSQAGTCLLCLLSKPWLRFRGLSQRRKIFLSPYMTGVQSFNLSSACTIRFLWKIMWSSLRR